MPEPMNVTHLTVAAPDQPQVQSRSIWGVSIVICAHNGADRLPATLAHLAAQTMPQGLLWEVIVVDNASIDGTAEVAKVCWPSDAPSQLRLVYETTLGLTRARCRGLEEAQYEVVSFVDDDNWVAPDWVSIVADVMAHRKDVGACGGCVEAQCEQIPPPWFDRCREYYAVGTQHECGGDITWSRGYLWGAGLTVRKSAWKELGARGFCFQLNDREGGELMSGGDAEVCLALRLAGWKIWYEPTLNLRHFIPAGRLKWEYLERVARGFGSASVILTAYSTVRQDRTQGIMVWMRSNWLCQTSVSLLRLVRLCGRCIFASTKWEGNEAALEILCKRETLFKFFEMRGAYDRLCRRIHQMFLSGNLVAWPSPVRGGDALFITGRHYPRRQD
ncbi:MAG: glycosyltransferase family 2 protein [Nitrospira sp.]|nr:glycosyltransferase family 2 protein [Nitrospira sp.]